MKTGADIVKYLEDNKGKINHINSDYQIQVYDGSPCQGAIRFGDVAIVKMEERTAGVLSFFLQNPDDIYGIYYKRESILKGTDKVTKVFYDFEDHMNIENVMAALFLLK